MSPPVDGRALRDAAAGMLAARMSARFLEEHACIPLTLDAGTVTIAVGRPLSRVTIAELGRFFGATVHELPVPLDDVRTALLAVTREDSRLASEIDVGISVSGRVEGDDHTAVARTAVDRTADRDGAAAGALGADEAPVVTLVNGVLRDALRTNASDIHVEPSESGLRIRFRLDGVLQEIARPSREYRDAVVSRLKILAGLDIGERRLPQDGRVRLRLDGRDVDLRVSSLPSLHGESLVLRILDHAGGARTLQELGVPEAWQPMMTRLMARTSGLTLVTGPTGSGKTTTLYAALALRNQPGVKVVTVEDPVEYRIPGVVQVPVNRKAGLEFANALRAILRHDPDVVMIGEMRDAETASIAMRAALTGHQVLSTLHTTDAVSAIARLIDMGIEPYLVASTLQGILAQRLVRTLCRACTTPGTGCVQCVGTGYRGRTGLFEMIEITDRWRTLIARGASMDQLRELAREDGVAPLREAGMALVARGITTQDEVLRVLDV